ncbi:MAG TPA: chromosome segregation protein SMC [Thermoanaerobaculia bacterium]|nr:chromosome segregation protein SMC [Thermoanaerobaculia bacterium]
MLRLKRVEISGFKSFYEKVDLAFPGSVTAVVGPNGCGKSNISDAVAWALGEQSAKVLRGEKMDDVIFNGSAKRRPLGMAEVILTLTASNGDSEKGDADGTLRVGRRVYRDGDGEYFLNDKQVRLRDIQDQLLGTGLGVRAYSVIEQGRIDQVLSTKPQDRRRLIEEAAGITKYKLKKRLAEGKLEETKGNLLRLSDIISEIERNVTSLKRQASRAARYKEQSELLRQRKASLMRARGDVLREALRAAERVRDERRDREAEAAATLARAEAALATSRLDANEATGQRDALREVLASLEASIARDDAMLDANRRAAIDLAGRRAALEREGRDFSAEQARAASDLTDLEDRLERAVAEARARSLAREEADRKASDASATCAMLERELEETRGHALSASGERIATRNARHEVDLAAERIAASLARLNQAAAKIVEELVGREKEASEAEQEAARLAAAAAMATAAVARIEEELTSVAAALVEAEAAREAARQSSSALEHRLAAIAETLRARETSVNELAGVIRGAGLSAHGALSDRIRPRAGWEDAVGLVLGADTDALLATGDVGRAVEAMRSLSAARMVRADWRHEARTDRLDGAMGWDAVLENHAGLSLAERAALPPTFFVESLADALAMAERHPGATFVTRGREVVRGPIVRVAGPAAEASGLFALRRDEESLGRRLAEARAALEGVDRRVEDLKSGRQRGEGELPPLRELEREARASHSAFAARLEERLAERDRLRRERDTLAEEHRALTDEAVGLDTRRRALEEQERAHAGAEDTAHQRIGMLSAALSESRAFAQSASDELSHRRTEAEVAAERRRAMEAARDTLLETRTTLERRLAEATEEEARITFRAAELAQEETDARERQKQNLGEREQKAVAHAAVVEAAKEKAAQVEAAEVSTRSDRALLDAAREARFEAEVTATRGASDLEHLVAQAREEFGVEPEDLEAPADTTPEGLAALETEVAELVASLERLGPVNVLAFEEHKEMSERLVFLTTQRDDLLKSIAELQESIRKINATSSERFAEAFREINENFKQMFERLFQGGAAEMKLLDENDMLESGIEIDAHPPGKRNQSILLLSGGEKALTAIALLMAIFRFKPSPFCILDEVDAPLDEANIDRFTKLLRDMTEETQFIAITHNKRTMETADVMYGVTMEEPGCSKIVSVRFD